MGGSKKWANIWHLMGGDTYSFSLVLRLSREHCKTSIWPNVTQHLRNFQPKWVKRPEEPIFQPHWLPSLKDLAALTLRSIFQLKIYHLVIIGFLNVYCIEGKCLLAQIFSPFSTIWKSPPGYYVAAAHVMPGMRVQTHLLTPTHIIILGK